MPRPTTQTGRRLTQPQGSGVLRRECSSQNYFFDLREVARVPEARRMEDKDERPHGSLDQPAPIGFREARRFNQGSNDLEICAP